MLGFTGELSTTFGFRHYLTTAALTVFQPGAENFALNFFDLYYKCEPLVADSSIAMAFVFGSKSMHPVSKIIAKLYIGRLEAPNVAAAAGTVHNFRYRVLWRNSASTRGIPTVHMRFIRDTVAGTEHSIIGWS